MFLTKKTKAKILSIHRFPVILTVLISLIVLSSFAPIKEEDNHVLTIEVQDLRSNKGVVVFALYNKADALPDEHYRKYFKKHREDHQWKFRSSIP